MTDLEFLQDCLAFKTPYAKFLLRRAKALASVEQKATGHSLGTSWQLAAEFLEKEKVK